MRQFIRETFESKEDRREFLLLLIVIPFGGVALVAGAIALQILMGR